MRARRPNAVRSLMHLVAALVLFAATAQVATPDGAGPPWQFELTRRAFLDKGQAGYLEAVLALEEREHEVMNDLPQRRMLLDLLATHLALVGAHDAALRRDAELQRTFDREKPPAPNIDGLRAADAIAFILERAEGRRIVMFNEEHRSSVQRAFMARVLPGLRERGFTHLAVEALNAGESAAINERGYPTLGAGLYVRDPMFGDMLRLARELGFTVVAYDGRDPSIDPADLMAQTNAREAIQARNIYERAMKDDPAAKVVVFAGRHHILESMPGSDWTPMGGLLKKLAGLDPLSVDLMVMCEAADLAIQPAAWTQAAERGLLRDDPVVLVDEADRPWTGPYGEMLDVVVFHPKTKLEDGGPRWRFAGGVRRAAHVELDPALLAEPVLLQAFRAGEADDAISADQLLIRPGEPVPALALRPGAYRVRMINRAGTTLFERAREVR